MPTKFRKVVHGRENTWEVGKHIWIGLFSRDASGRGALTHGDSDLF